MGYQVGIIGSGNWGTVVGMLAARNTANDEYFEKEVKIWVHEEIVEGKSLTETFNEMNENIKYLKGIRLPKNLVAYNNLKEVVSSSDVLVFVTPHQFIEKILNEIKTSIKSNAVAATFIKGFLLKKTTNEISLISQIIKDYLNIPICSMMGANIATQIASGELSEITLGYEEERSKEMFYRLYNQQSFRVRCVNDLYGVDICGSLKNIVAIATGFVDGLNLGGNTKSLVMRVGFNEMYKFSNQYYKGIKKETFLESCGFGDLVTTCFGGRNNRISSEYTKNYMKKTRKSWEELEKELLNGQKLQGTLTSIEVYEMISNKNDLEKFPFFTMVYKIVTNQVSPEEIIKTDFDILNK